jgi:glutamate/tyrosine decarboxylase-like PLP-dependent enzyme
LKEKQVLAARKLPDGSFGPSCGGPEASILSAMAFPVLDPMPNAVAQALKLLAAGFDLPSGPGIPLPGEEKAAAALGAAAERMRENYPYFHPLYAGQMLKPPHPVARAAYAMAMAVNPNNHALDGGRASSVMEMEAVREIAGMFGWREFVGHLTSGGTFANLEALWVAGQISPGQRVVASAQAHYTHERISSVLKLPFAAIPADAQGRMDVKALASRVAEGDIGTVVVTLGTTGLGAVDPLPEVLALRERYGFRVHVDAAYGGYFTLAENLAPEARRAYERIAEADSIVVDPHKHGLQPYGCGCVLFRDPGVGRFYKHDSPYTYFTSGELHLGEISLECSRAGAAAVALWTTQQALPLVAGGEFARGLEAGRQAALLLHDRLAGSSHSITPVKPELDIVVWAVGAETAEGSSAAARAVFEEAAARDLHLALVQMPVSLFAAGTWPGPSETTVTCLRSVLMKPEHLAWIEEIWTRLDDATHAVLEKWKEER